MPVLPNKAVMGLKETQHGGLDYALLREKNIKADDLLDFSVCINPFGPSPKVHEALKRSVIDRYPDTHAAALRERLAAVNGLEPVEVLVTNGLSQAILLIALAYIRSGDSVLVQEPGYGEYRAASELMGARVEYFLSYAENGFHPDIDNINALIRNGRPRIVWLCNPNNPTGSYLKESEVRAVLEACRKAGSLLILDEAYINFVHSAWSSLSFLKSENIILLRSMTKDFALPGLRLGYVLASSVCIEALGKAQPPWSINAAAQEAGLAALKSKDYYCKTWEKTVSLTRCFRSSLLGLGLEVLPGRANFLLLRLEDREGVQQHLWKSGILVRDCTSFGLPEFIRLGTRLEEENLQLLNCIKKKLKNA